MQSLSYQHIIDISMPLDVLTPNYPGDTKFQRETSIISIQGTDDVCTASSLVMSAHSGTHIDAPRHFMTDGITVLDIPPRRLISKAVVLARSGNAGLIGPDELNQVSLESGMSILLKTTNTPSAEQEHSTGTVRLSLPGARYLTERGVNLVGINAISIEVENDPSYPVHRHLLGKGLIVLENLVLDHVEEGIYTLIVFPLAIRDGDGAPARAMLLH